MLASPSDLIYFSEVAASNNISRAAERLGISQPSVTLAIQRIEDELGAKVFIRSKRGVTLTQAGKELYSQTKDLLQRWELLKTKALNSETLVRGNYTIGCHPSVALYSLPGFMPQLFKKHPDLEINLVHDLSRKIVERIISMEVDIGIVVNPIRHPDLVIHKLCHDEVTFWKSKKKPHSADVLICDLDLAQTQSVIKKMGKVGLHFKRTLKSGSLEVISALTAEGAGVGIIPGRVAALDKSLVKVDGSPSFTDEISVVYRVENRNVQTIQALREAITQVFTSLN